jgi:hypothetical protein
MIVKRNTIKFEIVDLIHGLFNIGWMLQVRCGSNVTDYFDFTLADPFKPEPTGNPDRSMSDYEF